MLSFYVLSALTIIAGSNVLADKNEEAIKPCMALFTPENVELGCCTTFQILAESTKACKTDKDKWTCDLSKCMLEKHGYIYDVNEEIKKEKVEQILDKIAKIPAMREITNHVKDNCLANDAYKEFQPETNCMAMKLHSCIYMVTMTKCKSWKPSDECKKIADQTETCKDTLFKN